MINCLTVILLKAALNTIKLNETNHIIIAVINNSSVLYLQIKEAVRGDIDYLLQLVMYAVLFVLVIWVGIIRAAV